MGINIAQFSYVIKNYLRRLGKPVIAVKGDENVHLFAVIEQTWHRNKSKFEGDYTQLGRVINDYYEYFGPADFDITQMGEEDFIYCDGVRYVFVKTDRVIVGGCIQYYTGILKRVCEVDGNVFG